MDSLYGARGCPQQTEIPRTGWRAAAVPAGGDLPEWRGEVVRGVSPGGDSDAYGFTVFVSALRRAMHPAADWDYVAVQGTIVTTENGPMQFHDHGQERAESAPHGEASPRSSCAFLPDRVSPRRAPSRLDRSSPIHTLLPYTCLALGGRLEGELDSFWKSVGFVDLPFGLVIERYAQFLKRRVENGTLRIGYLPELLDFELAAHELRFTSRTPYLAGGVAREPRVLVRRGAQLELHPLMRVSRFPCDAQALFETLARGDCIDCNVRSHETFLLLSVLHDASPEVIAVPPALGRKLWGLQCVGRFGGCDADIAAANALCAERRAH